MTHRRAVAVLTPLLVLAAAGAQEASEPPAFNLAAARANPLKGWTSAPLWTAPESQFAGIPSSLEFYYVSWSRLMNSNTGNAGNDFDWTYLEELLSGSASRSKHAVLRVICDYPGDAVFSVPQFLIDGGLLRTPYQDEEGSDSGSGNAPNYSDENLVTAMEAFIAEFGRVYDGNQRIGFIQIGMLGFWGEWHTHPHTDPNLNIAIPTSTKERVVRAFHAAFSRTQLQIRYPFDLKHASLVADPPGGFGPQGLVGSFGFHDDSFARYTLDGPANGGENVGWHFWPTMLANNAQDSWRTAAMGGEVRPELQGDPKYAPEVSIFDDNYQAATREHQDFNLCATTTHVTYMLNAWAFSGGYTGSALTKAVEAGDRLGYAFVVSDITFSEPSGDPAMTSVSVTVTQRGIAPFYYPLSLTLSCSGVSPALTATGVEAIIAEGDSETFSFSLPATSACLSAVTVGLESSITYAAKPIVFAQGDDGTVVVDLSRALSQIDCVESTADTSTCTTVGQELYTLTTAAANGGAACTGSSTLCVAGDGSIPLDCVESTADTSTCTAVGQELYTRTTAAANGGAACTGSSTLCVAGDGTIPMKTSAAVHSAWQLGWLVALAVAAANAPGY